MYRPFSAPCTCFRLRGPGLWLPCPSLRPPGYRRAPLRLVTALLLLLATTSLQAADNRTLRIAVASNFRIAAEELARTFTANTGISVDISSASSGILAAQIRRGAPFDLFLAADKLRAQALVDDGSSPAPARCYAQGSLVLLGATSLSALADANTSVAIANPRSAPYGVAAMAVLNREAFASADNRRLVQGSNVQQALQFFLSGGAAMALVAQSLSLSEGLAIPQDWHPPIQQFAVIIGRSKNPAQARAFMDYVLSPKVQGALTDFGYQPCS